MPTVRTRDGVNLYVKDWGQGRPVVLLHGWPLNADMWEYQAPALAEAGFRVIAYDRRGFGRSDQPGTGYDYDTLTNDLEDVLDTTGARHAALVGFSMGGGEVARFLGRHGGHSLFKAALISSVVPGMLKSDANPDGVPKEQFDTMIAGLKEDRPAFLAEFGKMFVGAGPISKPVSAPMMDWMQSMALMASPIASAACVKSFGETDFTRDLKGFDLPVLLIHGTDDKTVPPKPTAHRVKALVPHAELIEYEGAPHATVFTEAARLAGDLVAFLRR